MLSIGKLGSASEDYYLAVVAAGREDYYLRDDEAPGRWLSDGGLGLSGEVERRRAARAACRPRSPTAMSSWCGARRRTGAHAGL